MRFQRSSFLCGCPALRRLSAEWKFLLLFGFCALLLTFCAAGCQLEGPGVAPGPEQNGVKARVVQVVDGDTVTVRFLPGAAVVPQGRVYRVATPGGWIGVGATEKVRLIGVNAPEIGPGEGRGDFFGEEAKRYTRHRLQNRVVMLLFDVQTRDRYGRLLAYVYVGESFFNLELVAEGCAQVYTVPPNVKYAAAFLEAQRRAIQEKRGLWREREFYARPVIGNRRSLVYHRAGCAGLPAPSNQVLFRNEKEAVLAGFRHCRDCFSPAAQ